MSKEKLGRNLPLVCAVSEAQHKGKKGWANVKVNGIADRVENEEQVYQEELIK